MKLIKLTNAKGQTRGNTQWGPGITHTAPGKGELCTAGWIHAYTDARLAMLMNPIHGNFGNPQMWIAKGEIGIADGLKVGCASLTTLCQRKLPVVSLEMRVRFGILCALEVCEDEKFRQWTEDWLNGKDRSAESAAERAAASAASAARAAKTARAEIDFVRLARLACRKEATP